MLVVKLLKKLNRLEKNGSTRIPKDVRQKVSSKACIVCWELYEADDRIQFGPVNRKREFQYEQDFHNKVDANYDAYNNVDEDDDKEEDGDSTSRHPVCWQQTGRPSIIPRTGFEDHMQHRWRRTTIQSPGRRRGLYIPLFLTNPLSQGKSTSLFEDEE